MKNLYFIYGLIAIMFSPILCVGQWQANMTSSLSSGEMQYKVYSDLNQYRYEFEQDGMKGVVIVNPETNVTAIILLNEKKVHYTPTNGILSGMNDPVQSYNTNKQYGEEKDEGTESMLGYDCVIESIYQSGEKIISRWYSADLNFPVRLEGYWAENTFMQLSDIQDWTVDPAKFTVPGDYIEVDENLNPVIPEPPPPENWSTKKAAVPVDMPLSRGMSIEVNIDESVYHKLMVENTGDTPAKFSYHSFIDGEELPDNVQGPAEYRTNRLYVGEDYNMTLDWKAGQMILIKVYEGSVNVKVIKE